MNGSTGRPLFRSIGLLVTLCAASQLKLQPELIFLELSGRVPLLSHPPHPPPSRRQIASRLRAEADTASERQDKAEGDERSRRNRLAETEGIVEGQGIAAAEYRLIQLQSAGAPPALRSAGLCRTQARVRVRRRSALAVLSPPAVA